MLYNRQSRGGDIYAICSGVTLLKAVPNISEIFSGSEGTWRLLKNKLQVIFQGVTLLETTPNISEIFSGSEGAWRLPENKLQAIFEGEKNEYCIMSF